MKINLVTTLELPGGFSIEAESPEECLILRMFANDKRKIIIANFGGNMSENRFSLLIKHAPNTACTGLGALSCPADCKGCESGDPAEQGCCSKSAPSQ